MNFVCTIDILRTRDQALAIGFKSPDACSRDEPHTVLNVLRPMGDVHRTFRALDAAPHASGALSARTKRTVCPCGNGIWRWPPMPAELVVRSGDAPAHWRERRRRQRRSLAGRKRGIACQPRHAKIRFDALIVRREILVSQRPIVAYAVERAHAKVARHVPLPVRCVDDGAAADGVIEHGGDVRFFVVDRIIGWSLTPIRIARPIMASSEFEVQVLGARFRIVRPVTLFERDDAQAGFGKTFGSHGASRPGADDEDIRVRLCDCPGHREASAPQDWRLFR